MDIIKRYINIQSNFLLITAILLFHISCSKPPDPDPPTTTVTTTLSKLQNIWIFESLNVYPTTDLSGAPFPGLKGNGIWYFNFSSTGKLYTFMVGSFDTANYVLRPDSVLLVNQYYSGVLSPKTDTVSIRMITTSSLVLANRNPAGDYGKFTFKK